MYLQCLGPLSSFPVVLLHGFLRMLRMPFSVAQSFCVNTEDPNETQPL